METQVGGQSPRKVKAGAGSTGTARASTETQEAQLWYEPVNQQGLPPRTPEPCRMRKPVQGFPNPAGTFENKKEVNFQEQQFIWNRKTEYHYPADRRSLWLSTQP